jgi:hypothetical protein
LAIRNLDFFAELHPQVSGDQTPHTINEEIIMKSIPPASATLGEST